jgi:hypothetical protein
MMRRCVRQWAFYFGPILTIPLLACLLQLRNPQVLFAMLTTAAVVLAIGLQNTNGNQHYAAPVACLTVYLVTEGIRALSVWNRKHRLTRRMVLSGIPFLIAAVFCARFNKYLKHPYPTFEEWSLQRAQIQNELEADGHPHLIIVRYQHGHHPWKEWVYNRADIDSANVVWGLELTEEQNQQLLRYYANRHTWLLDADANPPQLIPYSIALGSRMANSAPQRQNLH